MKTKTLIWILGVWMLSLLVLMLTGCRTKTVTEYVAVLDTTYSAIRDTVTKIVTKTVTKTDSAAGYHFRDRKEKIYRTRDRTVTLNDRGDTTRVDTHIATMHYLQETDSTGYYRDRCDSLTLEAETYKSRCDSLQSIIDRQHEKIVSEKASWWQRWKWRVIALAALCAVSLLIWRGFRKIKNRFRY